MIDVGGVGEEVGVVVRLRIWGDRFDSCGVVFFFEIIEVVIFENFCYRMCLGWFER